MKVPKGAWLPAMLLLLSVLIGGCGRKGDPVAPDEPVSQDRQPHHSDEAPDVPQTDVAH
ncbi:MAG TPA: lipoprotein [Nitrospiria bacterium]|nr:lipoprotein [Nitrospiria bacterium]